MAPTTQRTSNRPSVPYSSSTAPRMHREHQPGLTALSSSTTIIRDDPPDIGEFISAEVNPDRSVLGPSSLHEEQNGVTVVGVSSVPGPYISEILLIGEGSPAERNPEDGNAFGTTAPATADTESNNLGTTVQSTRREQTSPHDQDNQEEIHIPSGHATRVPVFGVLDVTDAPLIPNILDMTYAYHREFPEAPRGTARVLDLRSSIVRARTDRGTARRLSEPIPIRENPHPSIINIADYIVGTTFDRRSGEIQIVIDPGTAPQQFLILGADIDHLTAEPLITLSSSEDLYQDVMEAGLVRRTLVVNYNGPVHAVLRQLFPEGIPPAFMAPPIFGRPRGPTNQHSPEYQWAPQRAQPISEFNKENLNAAGQAALKEKQERERNAYRLLQMEDYAGHIPNPPTAALLESLRIVGRGGPSSPLTQESPAPIISDGIHDTTRPTESLHMRDSDIELLPHRSAMPLLIDDHLLHRQLERQAYEGFDSLDTGGYQPPRFHRLPRSDRRWASVPNICLINSD
jgi:hypothetical protein